MLASTLPPTAQCYDATLRIARWTDPSDLAMVRDWFYPHKIKLRNRMTPTSDPYTAVADDETGSSPSDDVVSARTKENADKRRAIDRVESYTWHDKLVPHALLATASLVDAQLHYDEAYLDTRQLDSNAADDAQRPRDLQFRISTTAMKSIFAMAFCRFVNGFVDRDVVRSSKALRQTGLNVPGAGSSIRENDDGSDSEQEDDASDEDENGDDGVDAGSMGAVPKGSGESSMYKHATTIGMPTSFVHLRHKATHGRDLPGMQELVGKTAEALDWLWDKWWRVNAKGDPAVCLWELQQWSDALLRYRAETQQPRQIREQTVRHERDQEMTEEPFGDEMDGVWEIVTKDGVTRFVRKQAAVVE